MKCNCRILCMCRVSWEPLLKDIEPDKEKLPVCQ